jgi:hypothetical protein
MSSLAQAHRQFADECLEWAKSTNTDHVREIYLKMARDLLAATTLATPATPVAPSDSDTFEPTPPRNASKLPAPGESVRWVHE